MSLGMIHKARFAAITIASQIFCRGISFTISWNPAKQPDPRIHHSRRSAT
jgi:hypothetical protein